MKETSYYQNVRSEIAPLLTPRPRRLLDIGCGEGSTIAWAKEQGLCDWAGGLEPIATITQAARLDQSWSMPVEAALNNKLLPEADTILCLDVLEHLIDPWGVTRQLAELLPKGGAIVASIPNIRHYKLVLALLFKGDFRYRDAGILDSTHLRFFTRETACELFEQAGLKITCCSGMPPMKPWKNRWIINKLSGGRMASLYPITFHIRAEKV